MASLVWRTSITEESILRDQTDKNMDSSFKKSYACAHLAMRAGFYVAYTSQSLISDFKELFKAVQESSECSTLLNSIEKQAKFLSDIAFDVVH